MNARHGCLLFVLAIFGCGGGGSSGGGTTPPPNPAPPVNYSIGFSVTGLAGDGLVVTGLGQNVPVDADGSFTLASSVASGTAYNVTVQTHPTGPQQYCAVSNGSGTLGGNVTNIAINCMAGIVVQGQVTDEPIPGAVVTFTIGNLTFTTVADGNGLYELLVGSDDEEAVVIARARGVGGQAFVDFRGVFGLFGALDEDDALDITNVSTARFILMSRFLSNLSTATAAELAAAESLVTTTELLNLAVAIKVIVDNPDFDLPDGFATTFDFANDIEAVRLFIVEANSATSPTPFEQARTALLADSSLIPGFSQESLAAAYYLIPPTPEQLMAPMGHKLELDEGGTGTFLTTDANGASSQTYTFEWAFADGTLTLTYDEPEPGQFLLGGNLSPNFAYSLGLISEEELNRLNNFGGSILNYHQYPIQDVFRAVSAGGDVIPVLVERSYLRVFSPWNSDGQGVIEPSDWYPAPLIGGYEFQEASDFDGLGFVQEQVVGEWAMYLYREYGPFMSALDPEGRYVEAFFADLVTFNANGTASAQFYPEPIQWELTQDGRIVMQLGEEWIQEVRMLEQRGPVVGTFIEVFHVPTEKRYGGNVFAVRRDSAFQPGTAHYTTSGNEFWLSYSGLWPARYWDSVGVNLVALAVENFSIGGPIFDANGSYANLNRFWQQGQIQESVLQYGTWSMDEEGFLFAERTGPSANFYSTRTLWPVAEDADDFMYSIEEQWILEASSEEMRVWSPLRIGIHRKEPRLSVSN